MAKSWSLLLILLAATCRLDSDREQTQHLPSLAITHVVVIDGSGAPPEPDVTVVITGSRITALGKTGQVQIPSGAHVVDASGGYMIPGLWDMHLHSSYVGWSAPEDSWFIETAELNKSVVYPLLVAHGVTGIRDTGGDLATLNHWREEIATGEIIGPRMVVSGPVLEGPDTRHTHGIAVVASPQEGRQVVDSLVESGADFIKVRYGYSRETYLAIADQSRRHGIPFAGHLPTVVTPAEAFSIGQRSIEHFTWSWMVYTSRDDALREGRTDWRRLLDTYDSGLADSLFRLWAANDTWFCPTLVLDRRLYYLAELDAETVPGIQYVPAPWIERSWAPAQQRAKSRTLTAEDLAIGRERFAKQIELVGDMHRHGVRLLAGTDAAGLYLVPGLSLHEELTYLVDGGLTPMETLQAATYNPAMFLGALDSLGTIQEGKVADLVLLDGNPLDDIRNTQRIRAVVLNGRFLSSQSLREMLEQVKRVAAGF
jgi:imidazolonepropionase-like amidohydrolase